MLVIEHVIDFLIYIMNLFRLYFSDCEKGQEFITDKSYEDNQEFFQKIFEIGRRYKIMNPKKMSNTYRKLMYMLMVGRLLLFRFILFDLSFNFVNYFK